MSGFFPVPKTSADAALTLYRSPTGGEGTAGTLVKSAAPGRIYKVRAKCLSATAYTLMVFDKAIAPVNGDAPIWQWDLPVSGEVADDFSLWGLQYKLGLGLAISSTKGTLTLAVANDLLAKLLFI